MSNISLNSVGFEPNMPVFTRYTGSPSNQSRTVGSKAGRDRSMVLSAGSIRSALSALAHAMHSGMGPTHFITINWQQAGVEDGLAATGRFLKLLKDAARRHGWETAHIWVRENGAVHGDHVHILLHLPAEAHDWFKRHKAGWLRQCGAQRVAGASLTLRVAGAAFVTSPQSMTDPALYSANLHHVAAYILKHCAPSVAMLFGIDSKGTCLVEGKRLSISQNIHKKAQQICHQCR